MSVNNTQALDCGPSATFVSSVSTNSPLTIRVAEADDDNDDNREKAHVPEQKHNSNSKAPKLKSLNIRKITKVT